MRSHLAAACMAIALVFPAQKASGNAAVVVGNCNIINQSIAISNGSVLNQVIDCVPKRASDSFRVRYVWLDDISLSLVLSNVISEPLESLLGRAPILVRNEVHSEILKIWSRFGKLATDVPSAGLVTDVYGGKGTKAFYDLSLKDLDEEVRDRLRLFRAEPIVWPYVKPSQEMQQNRRLPEDINVTYGSQYADDSAESIIAEFQANAGDLSQLSARILTCTILYDYVTDEEFRRYWEDAKLISELIDQDRSFGDYVFPDGRGFEDLPDWLANGAYAQAAYFGRNNWPKDFLLRAGSLNIDDCGGQRGFSFAALPRKMFVKFAVFEFTNNRFDLQSIKYELDQKLELRTTATYDLFAEPKLGSLSPGAGRSVIIPISIELRYAIDESPFLFIRPNEESDRIFDAIQETQADTFSVNGRFSVEKESFPRPKFNGITQTYLYGPAINILTANVGGEEISVRSAPATAAVTNGYFEEGSCPFLYFIKHDGTVLPYGRILVGASSEDKSRVEAIDIPEGTKFVVIQEEEPEVTYLRRAQVIGVSDDIVIAEHQNVKLFPEQSVALEVPITPTQVGLQSGDASLSLPSHRLLVEGFYKTQP